MSHQDDLVAALDNHEITDDGGELVEETTTEEPTTQEQTPVEEDAPAEKPAKSEGKSTQEEPDEDENEPELVETASDETGKRYVPESRFKEVYARMKAAERAAKSKPATVDQPVKPVEHKPVDRLDAIEIETLRNTLPQFNPESNEYSREVDELGYSIYESAKDEKGNYQMTRLEAGRKAVAMAKKIATKVADVKSEARIVKAQQSDQGITSRVLNRESTQIDPDKMTLEEKEEWLKANGHW